MENIFSPWKPNTPYRFKNLLYQSKNMLTRELGVRKEYFALQELTPTYANSVHTVIKIIGNTPGIIVAFCVGEVTQRYKVRIKYI